MIWFILPPTVLAVWLIVRNEQRIRAERKAVREATRRGHP